MGDRMKITYPSLELHPLFRASDNESLPAYIEIDPDAGELSAGVGQKSGTPIYVWLKKACRVGVSAHLMHDEIKELLDEIKPLAEVVASGYAEKWDGSNYVGRLDADAEGALSKIEQICGERETDGGGVWDAGNWFSDSPPHEITAKTTDSELVEVANSYKAEAARDGITLDGLETYFDDLRDRRINRG
jgi:hypothetical protein